MSLLTVEKMNKTFRARGREVRALADVSLELSEGEILGIAGESGSGKSTLARVITGLVPADSGRIRMGERVYRAGQEKPPGWLREGMQMIFQNASGSFHPRKTVGRTILDAAKHFPDENGKVRGKDEILGLMEVCGLPEEIFDRYPWEVSGGQCQRAAVVRALIVQPKILILDEATSALDVLVQKNIISLLQELHRRNHMTMMFISHDLALLSIVCDRLIIMKNGMTAEEGTTEKVLSEPENSYTKQLLDSVL